MLKLFSCGHVMESVTDASLNYQNFYTWRLVRQITWMLCDFPYPVINETKEAYSVVTPGACLWNFPLNTKIVLWNAILLMIESSMDIFLQLHIVFFASVDVFFFWRNRSKRCMSLAQKLRKQLNEPFRYIEVFVFHPLIIQGFTSPSIPFVSLSFH